MCDLMVFGAPRDLFLEEEFDSLRRFIDNGGSLAFFIPDSSKLTNVNNFLDEYGLNAECDEVIRASYYKYFHPRHAFISNGVLHPDLNTARQHRTSSSNEGKIENHASNDCCLFKDHLVFVYPNGTVIDSQTPSIPILSSGSTSIPINQAVAGVVEVESNRGRILLAGSVDIFSDKWIDVEDNRILSEILFDFLLRVDETIEFDRITATASSLEEKRSVPDIESLSSNLKIGLQEEHSLPQDIMKLYDNTQFGFDVNLVPEVLKLYQALNVAHKPLTLIAPEFERPIPRLKLATFKPRMRNLPSPPLELFDLDEQFADRGTRLSQLVTKCHDTNDIEHFVRGAGAIFDISRNLDDKSPKSILHFIFKAVSIIGFINKFTNEI